ncbi:MAG: YbaK/EbsC family protein [Synergistota bacterium]|nr:YbaK/EbsC family protein [Synergistota bacterium]
MRLSKMLLPTVKDAPRGVTDPTVVRLLRAGAVTADPRGRNLGLLPMGVTLWTHMASRIGERALEAGFQPVDIRPLNKSVLPLAGRLVKSYRHLPLTFILNDLRECSAAGLAPDAETLEKMTDLFLDLAGPLFEGLDVLEGEGVSEAEPVRYRAVRAPAGSWLSFDGMACTACSWCGDASSPTAPPAPAETAEAGPLEDVETPGADTIVELCRQLDISPEITLKTMFYAVETQEGKEILAVLVSGRHQINEAKLAALLGGASVRFADPLEIREAVGDLAGYLGPVGLPKNVRILADSHVEGGQGFVVGANKPGFHTRNACWGRDFKASLIADIISMESGFTCPRCGAPLQETGLVKTAETTRFPVETDLAFQDESGANRNAMLWTGSISVDAVVLSAAPKEGPMRRAASPWDVNMLIASMKNEDAVKLGETLQKELASAGFSVLLDDRNERAGSKFSDAELLGLPVTLVAGRGASEGKLELWKPDGTRDEITTAQALNAVKEALEA